MISRLRSFLGLPWGKTEASINERLFAQTTVSLDSSTVVAPAL